MTKLTDLLFGSIKDPIANAIVNILDKHQINKIKFTCGILDGYDIMESGCYTGSLEMIKYSYINGSELRNMNILIEHGYLECVKYLHENGCPWNEKSCVAASRNGHLEILKYLHENGCYWNELSCKAAYENGHLEIIKYLCANELSI